MFVLSRAAFARARHVSVVLAIVLAGLFAAPGHAQATVVSLTFDDAHDDNYAAMEVLEDRDLPATLYVNSGTLGTATHMTAAQVLDLQHRGFEIGGHGRNHVDLTMLDEAALVEQVCADRQQLAALGIAARSFAFPYGAVNDDAKRVAEDCGYNSARALSGLRRPSCPTCDVAELLDPSGPYAIRTPDSNIGNTSTLASMQQVVDDAVAVEGEWIVLVFHDICDCPGSTYGISPELFEQFADWLQQQRAADRIELRTIGDVIGGPVLPAVATPLRPPAADRERAANGSFEALTEGSLADCHELTGFGDNDRSAMRSADAHDGTAALELSVSRFVDGDAKLGLKMDAPCSIDVEPGRRYRVGVWYKASAAPSFVAFVRQGSDWEWFDSSLYGVSSSGAWRRFEWTTSRVPAGASSMTVSVALHEVGWLRVDELSVVDADWHAPTLAVDLAALPDRYGGAAPLLVDVETDDLSGIDRVELLVDGVVATTASSAPWQIAWQPESDGLHELRVRTVDRSENATTSAATTIEIDRTGPTVSIDPDSVPLFRDTRQPLDVLVDVSDASNVSTVELLVDGVVVGSNSASPWSVSWSAPNDGEWELRARATDEFGAATTSAPRLVTIDTASPTLQLRCNGSACSSGVTNTALRVAPVAVDERSGVEELRYTLDGSVPQRTTGAAWTEPLVITGPVRIRARAWDHAGNASEVADQHLDVDLDVPMLVTWCTPHPCDARYGTTPVAIGASMHDAGRSDHVLEVRIDGQVEWREATSPLVFERSASVQLRARDAAGNVSDVSELVARIDSWRPDARVSTRTEGRVVRLRSGARRLLVDVRVAATDPGAASGRGSGVAEVRIYVGTRLVHRTTGPRWGWRGQLVLAGIHPRAVTVVVVDRAGNERRIDGGRLHVTAAAR